MKLTRATAEEWASWFKCVSDPSRLLILHLLASRGRSMTVGEIVDELDIGQSTVSHHLHLLADTCFVWVEREGASSYYSINDSCLEQFPNAAGAVMGQLRGRGPAGSRISPPWVDAGGPRRGRAPASRPARGVK